MLETLYQIHRAKLLLPISPQAMDQHGLPRYHNFMLVRLIYHSNENLVGPIYAEKLVESGCLYVFIIEFPASLLPMEVPSHKSESPNPQINSVQCIAVSTTQKSTLLLIQ